MHVPVQREGVTVVVYLSLFLKRVDWSEKYNAQICIIFVWKIKFGEIQNLKTNLLMFSCSSWYTKMAGWRACLFVDFSIYYFNNLQDFQDWLGALVP